LPSRAWQFRQLRFWNTAAPCSCRGLLRRTIFSGTGSPLQAVITGDQGDVAPWYVNTPSTAKVTTTASTATGRRLGARSPRLDTNGTRNRPPIRSRGKTRMRNVSAPAGLSDSSPNNHRKGHSGLGLAPPWVGSGGPLGPFGPRTAARTT